MNMNVWMRLGALGLLPIAAVATLLLLGYRLVLPPLTAADWAAWVQAIGTLIALALTFIPSMQSIRLARQSLEDARAREIRDRFAQARLLRREAEARMLKTRAVTRKFGAILERYFSSVEALPDTRSEFKRLKDQALAILENIMEEAVVSMRTEDAIGEVDAFIGEMESLVNYLFRVASDAEFNSNVGATIKRADLRHSANLRLANFLNYIREEVTADAIYFENLQFNLEKQFNENIHSKVRAETPRYFSDSIDAASVQIADILREMENIGENIVKREIEKIRTRLRECASEHSFTVHMATADTGLEKEFDRIFNTAAWKLDVILNKMRSVPDLRVNTMDVQDIVMQLRTELAEFKRLSMRELEVSIISNA